MPGSRLHTVVETPEFSREAARLLTAIERLALILHLAGNPRAGAVMPGTGGARKLRWATGNRGKSGSVRVITFYSGTDIPVFLIAIFGKSAKVNVTKAEANEMKQGLADFVKAYRARI